MKLLTGTVPDNKVKSIVADLKLDTYKPSKEDKINLLSIILHHISSYAGVQRLTTNCKHLIMGVTFLNIHNWVAHINKDDTVTIIPWFLSLFRFQTNPQK